MNPDGFEATFRVQIERVAAWERLTADAAAVEPGAQFPLAGFAANVTIVDAEPPGRLRVTKDDEPCAGTDIVVTLEDDATGTRIHVVQSRFGDWFAAARDMMAIGWRFIVADLQTYLATGADAHRHLRPWGDLGAEVAVVDGGIRVTRVREGTLAARLGLTDDDLLVTLGGAPVASLDDVVTILRVLGDGDHAVAAEWIRSGSLQSAPAPG